MELKKIFVIKGLTEIYINGALEVIFKWIILLIFSKKLFFEKRENINFLERNKFKDGNNDALQ